MTSFWCICFKLWTDFIHFSGVSIVDFENVNVCWEGYQVTVLNVNNKQNIKTSLDFALVSSFLTLQTINAKKRPFIFDYESMFTCFSLTIFDKCTLCVYHWQFLTKWLEIDISDLTILCLLLSYNSYYYFHVKSNLPKNLTH